jgi:opacity protein-like surface antigen
MPCDPVNGFSMRTMYLNARSNRLPFFMKTLSVLTVLASLWVANAAKAVDDKTFFSGAHLGVTLDECYHYYNTEGADGEVLANGGILEHYGAAPDGERQIDFRTRSVPMRRIYVIVRKKDRKIVSVLYWKMGHNETFSQEEIRYLKNLNRGHGSLVIHIDDKYKDTSGTEFEVTTAEQENIERTQ